MGEDYTQQFLEEDSIPFDGPTFSEVERIGRYVRRWATNLTQWEQEAVVRELKKRRFVDNPACNRRAGEDKDFNLSGRWRQAKVWYDNGAGQLPSGLYEELHWDYLQPPSVADSWPTPADANDWTKLDERARVFQVRIFNPQIKTYTGIRDIYYIMYPNVATATVREFCEALPARGTLTNPTFDKQTQMTGSYAFRYVHNEEQGDGSSNVIGVLVNLTMIATDFIITLDGCGMRESIRYLLNSPTIPVSGDEVFPASSSGVEYEMHIEFDRLFGVFDITITKKEQKMLTAGIITTNDNLEATKTEQTFTGVRIGGLDDQGNSVPVWNPGVSPAGTSVDQEVSKNQNCTTDVHQQKRVAKSWLSQAISKMLDLFKGEVSVTDKNQAIVVADPVTPTGGVYQETSADENTDGTYTNRIRTITEKTVAKASTRNQQTIFSTRAVVTDKGQSPATSLAASAAAGVIVSKTGQRTAGDLLDVDTDTVTEVPVSGATADNSKTQFETRVSITDRNQPAGTVLTPADPAGGVVVTKRGEKTDGGSLNVSTETRTELPVTAAEASATKTLFEISTEQTDKAQDPATSLVPPAAAGGVVVTKRGQKTPGVLLDVTTQTRTEQPVSSAAVANDATIFETKASTTDKSQAPATPLTASAAGGVITSKRGQKTAGDLLDVTTDVVTEQPVTSARVSGTKTLFDAEVSQVDKNQNAATDLTVPAPAGGVVVTKSGDKTPGGSLDVTTQTKTEQNVANASVMNMVTAKETESQVTEKGAAAGTDLSASLDDSTHILVQKHGQKTPGVLLDVTVITKTPIASNLTFTLPESQGTEILQYFNNQTQAVVQGWLDALDPKRSNVLFSYGGKNQYGLFDGHIRSKAAITLANGNVLWQLLGKAEILQRDHQDNTGVHWVFSYLVTFNLASVSGRQLAETMLDGGGPGSSIGGGGERCDIKRVVSIERFVQVDGTTDGAGVWTPGALTPAFADADSNTIFLAAHPDGWGNS